MGEKTQQNFLSIELNQNNVKPQENSSSLFLTHFFFFLLQTILSEVSTNEGGASLFLFDSWLDLNPNWADLSNSQVWLD